MRKPSMLSRIVGGFRALARKIGSPQLGGSGQVDLHGSSGGWGGSWLRWMLPGTNVDFQAKAGDLYDNSVVAICLNHACRLWNAAPIQVSRLKEKVWETEPTHKLSVAFCYGNPFYDQSVLWYGVLLSWFCDGNAYLLKLRTASGAVAGYVYLPHFFVEPRSKDQRRLITHYLYTPPGGGVQAIILPEDIVHLRHGVDPRDWMRGLSPLRAQLRPIVSDNHFDTMMAALLENGAVPSVMFSPKMADRSDPGPTDDQRQTFMNLLRQKTTGDRRGEGVLAPFALDVIPIAFSPKDLVLDKAAALPMAKICSAFGFDPMAVGLPSPNKTYSNYEQAQEAAYEIGIKPAQRVIATQLDQQTLADFGDFNLGSLKVTWDYSDVPWLQEDENALAERVRGLFKDLLLKRAEARRELGYEVDSAADDVWYSDVMMRVSPEQAMQRDKQSSESVKRRRAFEAAGFDEPDGDE